MSKAALFISKMEKAGLPELVINAFLDYYKKLTEGRSGLIREKDIQAPGSDKLIDSGELETPGNAPLEKLAVVKLNGGLGTSMGLKKAKSLLPVKPGYNFLDLIALQILKLRANSDIKVPLLFMNSFNTREDTLVYLEKYPELTNEILPLDFIQNKFPKVRQDDFTPLDLKDEKLNWNPPGHGEIYLVMNISGTLDKLIKAGKEYVFISNSDNLGATVDPAILEYISTNSIPFLMEVCLRTEMDRKGGHLAQTRGGQLLLREVAQCPAEEIDHFQNIEKYSYFNTNSLWINLNCLKKELDKNMGILPLPLIVNRKQVNGIDVYQLESAMGAAISVFKGSRALIVDRSRFIPVKKTNDLLAIWSDSYRVNEDHTISLDNEYSLSPLVELDERYYRTVIQLDKHFPAGAPSLKACRSFKVEGDVYFGSNIKASGETSLKSRQKLKLDNIELSGHLNY